MGRRNVRINAADLPERLSEINGKVVHVVLLQGTTYTGTVIECKEGSIKVRDANASWTNIKRHTHTLALTDIQEVIIDLVTAF